MVDNANSASSALVERKLQQSHDDKIAVILAASWLQKAVEALAAAIVAATTSGASVAPLAK